MQAMPIAHPAPLNATGRKKVVVRRFDRERMLGYMTPSNFVRGCGDAAWIEVLDFLGRIANLPLNEVKMVSFVRDFHAAEPNPEGILRRTFISRPRSAGLWLRLNFRDQDSIEGLAANDLTLLDGEGLIFSPPDMRSNAQRIYVPRRALASLQVLGVIGASGRGTSNAAAADRSRAALRDETQESLFDLDAGHDTERRRPN